MEHTSDSLMKKTIPELKELCKSLGLKVTGNKLQLIDRILHVDDIKREEEEKRQKKEQEKLNKLHQKSIEKERKKREKEEEKERKKEERARFREEEKRKKKEEDEREREHWREEFRKYYGSQSGSYGGAYSGAGSSGNSGSGGAGPSSFSSTSLTDAFRFLELTSGNIQPGDVNRAFKRLSLKYHPDKGGTTEQQQKLTQCRELLKNYGYS